MRTHRRIAAAALGALLALSSLPLGAVPALAEDAVDAGQFDTLLGMDQVRPAGFDENSEENPYGEGKNQPFLMVEETELMMYSIIRQGSTAYTNWYDGWSGEDGTLNIGNGSSQGSFNDKGSYSETRKLAYVESVAFDPTGTGRNDHAAYVGFDRNENSIVIWVVDTREVGRTREVSIPLTKGNDSWLENTNYNNGANENWLAGNYFAITAGDYDGSGKETLVVYVPNDNGDYGLVQLSCTEGVESLSFVEDSAQKTLLHPRYVGEKYGQAMSAFHKRETKLGCDLATGDFNGDGIDDLAVVSYINGCAEEKTDGVSWFNLDRDYYCPWLNVAYGENGSGSVLDNATSGFCALSKQAGTDEGYYNITSMVAPGIAAGDTDGDGQDEIVVAGTENVTKTQPYSRLVDEPYDINNNMWVIAGFNVQDDGSLLGPDAGGLGQTTFVETEANAWTSGGTGGMRFRSPLAVETVAFNGGGKAEHVFVNGTIYDMSSGSPDPLYTVDFFQEDSGLGPSGAVDEHFVPSVAVGNFDNNEWGYEQVVYVMAEKEEGYDRYYYSIGLTGGANYDGEGGPVGSLEGPSTRVFYDVRGTGFSEQPMLGDYVGSSTQQVGVVLTPIDRDEDGLMARYVGKTYAYSDPQVAAVLQMAPYFDEIDIGNDSGATTYAFTQTYEYTEGTIESRSFGAGFAAAFETPFMQVDVETGYVNDWSKSFEETLTRSTTDSFTAKAYDSVVVYRTPIFSYNYQLYDTTTGEWADLEGSGLTISVPKAPTYVQMSVDDYNAFAGVYNNMMEEAAQKAQVEFNKPMKEISLDYLGQEGNPWGYADDLDKLSINSYQLGYNGGETSSASLTGQATSETIERQSGFSFEMTMIFGHSSNVFTLMGGVNASYEKMSGSSTSTTTSSDTETSGTVQDLDSAWLLEEYGIPTYVTRSYGFTWELGSDTVDLGAAGSDALVIGYNVTGVTAPPPPVSDLSAELSGETRASLTWGDPTVEGRDVPTGYNVYAKGSDGTYVKLNDEPLGADAREYLATGLDTNTDYTFVVTTLSNSKESVWSNEANVTTPKAMVPLTFDYNGDEVTLSASHLGNVDIQSGDAVPEESIVYVELAPAPGYTITGVTINQDGREPEDAYMADGKFNFVIRAATTIEVTTQKIVDMSHVSYVATSTDADGTVMGTTQAWTAAGNPIDPAGAKVSGAVDLVATPADGYALKEWHVSTAAGENVINAAGNELTFYPYEASHKITPVFVPLDDESVARTVTVSASQGGSIQVTRGDEVLTPDESGSIAVARGDELTFTAVPDAYYNFIGWTDAFEDYGKSTSSITLRVGDNLTVGAEFDADLLYRIEYGAQNELGGSGTLTASVDGTTIATGSEFVPETPIDFAATADEGSRLFKWAVTEGTITTFPEMAEGLVTEDDYQLPLTADTTVTAYFKTIETYDLDVPGALGNGTVTVTRGGEAVEPGEGALGYGDVVTVTAEPRDGYVLTSLTVNGEELTPGDELLVTGPVSVGATFVESAAHAHGWGGPAWEWSDDGSSATATFACGCGEERTLDARVSTAADPDATCTEAGAAVVTAEVGFGGATYTDERPGGRIDPTGHDWVGPEWAWSEDGASCTATFACANDPRHVEVVDAEVSSRTEREATCAERGATAYTAEVEFDERSFSATCSREVPELGHEAGLVGAVDPTEWGPGYTGDVVCSVCGEVLREGEGIDALPVESEVMYRLYNRWTGEHLYTSSRGERRELVGLGWTDEGAAWASPLEGAPVYRLYNPWAEGGDHHYTASAAERDALVGAGWVDEGVAWLSAPEGAEGAVAVLRQYNPYAVAGTHSYTVDAAERDALVSVGWVDEGVAWYGVS